MSDWEMFKSLTSQVKQFVSSAAESIRQSTSYPSSSSSSNSVHFVRYEDSNLDIRKSMADRKELTRPELRSKIYVDAVEQTDVKLSTIQNLAFQGIPDSPKNLRAVYWKVLLNYDWLDSQDREVLLNSKRMHYEKLRKDYVDSLLEVQLEKTRIDSNDPLGASSIEKVEHDVGHERNWRLYEEIEKDILRTHSMLHFFSQRVSITLEESAPKKNVLETHYHVLLRIMYIYARLNPDLGYIQGMNEILAPIYYVFAQDSECEFIEADSYYCFANLMKELHSRFTMIDHVETKSFSEVDELMYILRQYDPELCEHLDRNRVDAKFFAFRWLTLLLSQEFSLPDVLRLWDSLFADPDRFQFLTYLCCAMISGIRSRLLNVGFSDILETLQRYPQVDIQSLIEIAIQIRVSVKSPRS